MLLAKRCAIPDCLVAIELMRNFGQHNALMCGFRRSRGRLVVTMDDDLQNPPEEIPKLIDAITTSRMDLVYGRYGGKQHESWRNLGSQLVNGFYRIVFKSKRTVSAFRIIRRELLESIFSYNLNFTFIDGLLAWNSQRIGEVSVDHHPRSTGRSGYSVAKLLGLAFNLLRIFRCSLCNSFRAWEYLPPVGGSASPSIISSATGLSGSMFQAMPRSSLPCWSSEGRNCSRWASSANILDGCT